MYLIIQPTRFCNIDCAYCYLDRRTDRARISPQTLDLIGQHIVAPSTKHCRISVGWHGCEPLSLPISFYEEAFSTFRVYSSTPLEHVFQTNATLITDDWIRFFKKYEIGIGVSVDGPSRFHDHS